MILKPIVAVNISVRTLAYASIKKLTVIKVPKYLMSRELRKVKRNAESEAIQKVQKRVKRGNRYLPIITCNTRKWNHYYGQTYNVSGDQMSLYANNWRDGDKMTFTAYQKSNPSHLPVLKKSDKHNDSKDITFSRLGLNVPLCDAINSLGIKRPSNVQSLAIPSILKYKNVILSAETGSGKTIAYLAPVIQKISDYKEANREVLRRRSPLGLVIVPSKELAEQIGSVALPIAARCGVGVSVMASGLLRNSPDSGMDLVVSTVGLVQPLISKGVYRIHKLNHIVIDEADTMFDDTFSFDVLDLLHNMKFKSNNESETINGVDGDSHVGAQLICVSATMPQNLEDTLGRVIELSNMTRLTTKTIHHIMPHVKHEFLKMDRKERHLKLLEIVKKEDAKRRPVMIFSNRTQSSDWIYHFLRENGIDCLRLNKGLSNEERLGQFLKFQEEEYNALSCTDLGSRGLDTQKVRHVINYDCPHFVSDYIHRSGRTGRIGSHQHCQVTSFVCFKPDNEMVKKLEYSIRMNQRIDFVDGNIKAEIKKHHTFREDMKQKRSMT